MPKLYVDLIEVRSANYNLPRMESKANLIRRRIYQLKTEIPEEICRQYEIGERLCQMCRQIKGLQTQIHELYRATNFCMEQYAEAEYENEKNAKAFL